ncbi:MAG: P-II family nitrogen regulator [Burkholderiales bacterium]
MINKHTKTLLTVVAESLLEPRLLAELKRHTAHVWTSSEVRGAFPEGERSGDWDADRTIEIRVICEPSVADAIAQAIVTKYAPDYSVVVHFSEVQVLRPERF